MKLFRKSLQSRSTVRCYAKEEWFPFHTVKINKRECEFHHDSALRVKEESNEEHNQKLLPRFTNVNRRCCGRRVRTSSGSRHARTTRRHARRIQLRRHCFSTKRFSRASGTARFHSLPDKPAGWSISGDRLSARSPRHLFQGQYSTA